VHVLPGAVDERQLSTSAMVSCLARQLDRVGRSCRCLHVYGDGRGPGRRCPLGYVRGALPGDGGAFAESDKDQRPGLLVFDGVQRGQPPSQRYPPRRRDGPSSRRPEWAGPGEQKIAKAALAAVGHQLTLTRRASGADADPATVRVGIVAGLTYVDSRASIGAWHVRASKRPRG
jgi:hypothetical protein